MEELSIIKQVFSLIVWLQMNTKLQAHFNYDGTNDLIEAQVYNGEEELINFSLEAVLKKSEARVELEAKLLVAQLLELKNNKHYKLT